MSGLDSDAKVAMGAKAARPEAKLAKPLAQRWGDAARQLGLVVEQPPKKRTAPRVAIGILIGAGGAYLLDPERGAERRHRLSKLLGAG
ncbi:MAG TPA: hypothetical protein VE983_01790 [Solirubrobacteraceae bacterium]|nr:hypothetical protein [Solirubrobacteraceae bacterium]